MRRILDRLKNADERGAVIVELAIAIPLLLLFVSGIFDLGMAFYASRNVDEAARSAARAGAAAGDDRLADYVILRSLNDAFRDTEDFVYQVIVYQTPAGGDGAVPAACMAGGAPIAVAGECNVYDDTDLTNLDLADFTDETCAGEIDEAWCPTTRLTAFEAGGYLGVRIWVEHDALLGFFVKDGTFEKQSVFQIEPIGDFQKPPALPTATPTPVPTICSATIHENADFTGTVEHFLTGWSTVAAAPTVDYNSITVASGCKVLLMKETAGFETCELVSAGSSLVPMELDGDSNNLWLGSGTVPPCSDGTYLQPTPTPTVTPVPAATPGPGDIGPLTHCVWEGDTCSLPGPAIIKYGRSGQFVEQSYPNGGDVPCTNAEFGDPIPGKKKRCFYWLTSGQVPWVEVFDEPGDTGMTRWTASGGGIHGLSVDCYRRYGAGDETIITSETTQLDPGTPVDVVVNARSAGVLESTGVGRDYIELRYSLDGAAFVVADSIDGSFVSAALTAAGLTGSTLQVAVAMDVSNAEEYLCIDQISVAP